MGMNCEDHRKLILKASIEDLSPEEQQKLKAHLADCPCCAEEQHLTLDTLQQLRSESDVSVPRHFFVTGEKSRPTPWSLFQQMSLTWKAATALTLVGVGALVTLAVSNFQLRTQAGGLTLSLGKPLEVKQGGVPTLMNVDGLKADIVHALEEKARQERSSWREEMRKEVALSGRKLTQKQQKSLETALAEFEGRINERIIARDVASQASWKQSLGDLYRTIQSQRQRDLLATKNGIDRLAAQGEVRSNETEAILATLLQVAEYKTK